MIIRTAAAALVSRPWRQLAIFWVIVVSYVAVKGVSGGADKKTTWGFAALGGLLALVWWIGRSEAVRRCFATVLGEAEFDEAERPAPHHAMGRTWMWWFGGFALVAGLLAALEWRQPYYFVQDDNLTQFMPVVLQGCRSLLTEGVFPTWNPHQFLGSPTTSLGTYALTYPPTYAAYAVARWVLGNEYATLEVFCIAHLLAGYAAAFWAGRVLGLRPSLAAVVSVCFALSGFFLIAGRSWYYMTPCAVWLPLVVGLMERLRRQGADWKWVLATGGALGALFHAGNAQLWCYTMLLVSIGVGIWFICRAVPWSQVIPALSALVLGVAIAMPLLLPQFFETSALKRHAGDGTLLPHLPAMFLPYPLAQADYPGVSETPHIEQMGHLYYAGTVFSAAAALGMFSLMAHRWNRRHVAANVWLILASIALVLALGRIGGLWYALAKIPPFAGFKHPFKFIPFATLFMLLGGALLVERALRRWGAAQRLCEVSLCAVVAVLISYHAVMAQPSFCDYAFQPYPELPAEMQPLCDRQTPARMYAIGPRRSLAPEYGLSLMHQLPTVWGGYAFEGYDPLVRCGPQFAAAMDKLFAPAAVLGMQIELGIAELGLEERNSGKNAIDALQRTAMDEEGFWGRSFRHDLSHALSTLQTYGVRWVVVYNGPQKPHVAEGQTSEMFWKTDPVAEQVGQAVRERGRLLVHRPEVCLYELNGAAPLAFTSATPRQSLPIQFHAAGLTVDTSSLAAGGKVVVNVLDAPLLQADADGLALRAAADEWGRPVFHVPAGAQRLSVHYRPPWLAGGLLGALLLVGVWTAMRWRQRWNRIFDQVASRFSSTKPLPLRRAA